MDDEHSPLTKRLIREGCAPKAAHGPALRVDRPSLASEFQALLGRCRRAAPWSHTGGGNVADRNGRHVLTVDVNSELPDPTAAELAEWVCVAVNTCAGFRAVQQQQAAE